jgi:uncharacterized Zn-binding protein involved in type VI secretion
MARYYITVGDKTTAGGEVLDGSPTCTWHKKVLAISTSKIKCPACKTIGVLQVNIPRRDTSPEGETFALNGDFCICKCNPPPTLLASQSINMYGGDVDAPTFSSTAVWSATDSFWTDAHDQHFQLHDENTGDVLANWSYRITCNEKSIEGITDENGFTAKVSANQALTAIVEFHSPDNQGEIVDWRAE